ncbi:ras-related protein Rap-2b-like [Sycon ciliatum]|uniref:ras-related protein Rap-2b-like n=1 Tax=Sycon ciliatum TaxID=27933 RepID=UPI0020AE9B30|eukprot:scpid59020/ scgid18290/ Ras-like protein family member 12; RAS-like protein Ris
MNPSSMRPSTPVVSSKKRGRAMRELPRSGSQSALQKVTTDSDSSPPTTVEKKGRRGTRRVATPPTPTLGPTPVDVRIAMLGRGGVGKSALTVRFICHRFLSEYDPTLEDTYTKETKVSGDPVRLHILDTAGERETDLLYRRRQLEGITAFMIVFSIADRHTFRSARDMISVMAASRSDRFDLGLSTERPAVMLVGNKCDMKSQRQVSYAEASALATALNFQYMETSAADDGHSVRQAFHGLVKQAQANMAAEAAAKAKRREQLPTPVRQPRKSSSLFDLHLVAFRDKISRVIHVNV